MSNPSVSPAIDLAGLKSNPPKPTALSRAYHHLAYSYLPRRFPLLTAHDHEDIANETLQKMMTKIADIKYPTRILHEANWLALALIEKRSRLTLVSLEELSQGGIETDTKMLIGASVTEWKHKQEEEFMHERFQHALQGVLPQLPRKQQSFVLLYWAFLRVNPDGTRREFADSQGLSESNVNVTVKRIRDKVASVMKNTPMPQC